MHTTMHAYIHTHPTYVFPFLRPPTHPTHPPTPIAQDWVKLTTSTTDLAGVRRLGGLRGYRMEEVAQHKSPHDAWAVFMGKVCVVVGVGWYGACVDRPADRPTDRPTNQPIQGRPAGGCVSARVFSCIPVYACPLICRRYGHPTHTQPHPTQPISHTHTTHMRQQVYNITPYLHYHPGGADILVKAAGRDCTALFNRYHAWVNLDGLAGVSEWSDDCGREGGREGGRAGGEEGCVCVCVCVCLREREWYTGV
jgi:hypothetical protein